MKYTETDHVATNKKVVLGLSGGVDSATAALLLKENGYQVTGYYFDVLGNNDSGRDNAAQIAAQLGIDFISEDVSAEFSELVIENFCSEYMSGRTPNPCVICNPNIKFKKLIEVADRVGAAHVATGHYCKIVSDGGVYYLAVADSAAKDQSYMLYRLGQDVLSRLIFPLGELESKDATREIARRNSLQNADLKDSQEICFVDESQDYAKYIKALGYQSTPGDFVDADGKVVGRHKGIINYTRGQRKGLGLALGKPVFVVDIDCENNRIVVGEQSLIMEREVRSASNVFASPALAEALTGLGEGDGLAVLAKSRYAAAPAPAMLRMEGEVAVTVFDEAQRAPTPGQSIVFYEPEKKYVLGGGFIL